MNQKASRNLSDAVFTAVLTLFFLFFLPGLAASLGTMGIIYFDGLQELPPYALKAASAAVGMLAISTVMCAVLKADREFISWPLRLTLIGVVMLPFVRGSQKAFTLDPMDDAPTTGWLVNAQAGLGAMAKGFIEIVPAALCTVSVVLLAVGLTRLIRARYRR